MPTSPTSTKSGASPHASPSAGRTNTNRSASKVAPEDHIVRLAQLLFLLQTKATKPQRATAKWLCISVAWAEEIRFLSTAPLSVSWRRRRICARNARALRAFRSVADLHAGANPAIAVPHGSAARPIALRFHYVDRRRRHIDWRWRHIDRSGSRR